MKTSVDICAEKNWQVGDVLKSEEEQRNDHLWEITAIGKQIVIGIEVEQKDIPKIRNGEITLPINSEFLKWTNTSD